MLDTSWSEQVTPLQGSWLVQILAALFCFLFIDLFLASQWELWLLIFRTFGHPGKMFLSWRKQLCLFFMWDSPDSFLVILVHKRKRLCFGTRLEKSQELKLQINFVMLIDLNCKSIFTENIFWKWDISCVTTWSSGQVSRVLSLSLNEPGSSYTFLCFASATCTLDVKCFSSFQRCIVNAHQPFLASGHDIDALSSVLSRGCFLMYISVSCVCECVCVCGMVFHKRF